MSTPDFDCCSVCEDGERDYPDRLGCDAGVGKLLRNGRRFKGCSLPRLRYIMFLIQAGSGAMSRRSVLIVFGVVKSKDEQNDEVIATQRKFIKGLVLVPDKK